jgi:hypothetical protein
MNAFHNSSVAVAMIVCLAPVAKAQSVDDGSLRNKIEAVLDDRQLSELDRLRKLRAIIDAEQAKVTQSHIDIWIAKLGDEKFGERQKAQEELTAAGITAIDALAKGAQGKDRERRTRCFHVLTELVDAEDDVVSAKAIETIKQLASSQSPVAAKAAALLTELMKTDKERAIEAISTSGARVFIIRGNVFSVSFTDTAPMPELVRHLRVFPRLMSLSIRGGTITDGAFEELAKLENFRTLSLTETKITDEGFAKLATFKKLEGLHLRNETVTTTGLLNLGKSPNLRSLFLNDIRPTPEILAGLKELNLRYVTFSLERANDQELAAIGTLTNVFSLRLEDSPDVTNDGLATLSSLPLHTIEFSGTPISDDGLRHLSKMTTLERLDLDSAQITDEGLEHLKGLFGLEYVTLRGTQVTDEGAEKLQKAIPGIRRIYR